MAWHLLEFHGGYPPSSIDAGSRAGVPRDAKNPGRETHPDAYGYGRGKLTVFDAPRPFLSVTATVPWTEPAIESGSRSVLRLPKAALPPNQESNSGATFRVMLLPEAEHPGFAPQLSATRTL